MGSVRREDGQPEAVLVLKLSSMPLHHGVLGIIRSLGRAGIPVFAVAEDETSPAGWSRYLRGRFLWTPDLRDVDRVLDDLLRIGQSIGGQPVLIPTDDVGAILVAEHAPVLTPTFRLPRQPADLPRRLASKTSLADICRQLAVSIPRAQVFPSASVLLAAAEELTYPLVLKLEAPWEQDATAVLKSTSIVCSAEELQRLLLRVPAGHPLTLIAQEYLPPPAFESWFFHGYVGDQNGCPVFALSFTGRKIRSFPPDAGFTSMARAVDNPELRRIAERLLAATGYRGIIDLDFLLDRRSGQYYLLDANPRAGAQFVLARRSDGRDAAYALYRELTGAALPAQSAQVERLGICVEGYDALSAGWLLLHRRTSLSACFRTLREGPVVWAWFAPDDPVPWALMWLRFVWWQVALRALGRRPRMRRDHYRQPVRRDPHRSLRWPRQRHGAVPADSLDLCTHAGSDSTYPLLGRVLASHRRSIRNPNSSEGQKW